MDLTWETSKALEKCRSGPQGTCACLNLVPQGTYFLGGGVKHTAKGAPTSNHSSASGLPYHSTYQMKANPVAKQAQDTMLSLAGSVRARVRAGSLLCLLLRTVRSCLTLWSDGRIMGEIIRISSQQCPHSHNLPCTWTGQMSASGQYIRQSQHFGRPIAVRWTRTSTSLCTFGTPDVHERLGNNNLGMAVASLEFSRAGRKS